MVALKLALVDHLHKLVVGPVVLEQRSDGQLQHVKQVAFARFVEQERELGLDDSEWARSYSSSAKVAMKAMTLYIM